MIRTESIKIVFAFFMAGGIVMFVHRFILYPQNAADNNDDMEYKRTRASQYASKNQYVQLVYEHADSLEDDITAKIIRWISVHDDAKVEASTLFQSLAYYDSKSQQFKFLLTGNNGDQQLYCWIYSASLDQDKVTVEVHEMKTVLVRIEGELESNSVGTCDSTVVLHRASLTAEKDHDTRNKVSDTTDQLINARNRRVVGLISTSKQPPHKHYNWLINQCESRRVAIVQFRAEEKPLGSLGLQQSANSVVLCLQRTLSEIDVRELVEWIEFAKMAGVDQVVVSVRKSLGHHALSILRYYEQVGIVQLWLTESHDQHLNQSKKSTGNSLNNCLEFNRHQYAYIAAYDTLEFWVPPAEVTYAVMLGRLASQHGEKKAYAIKHVKFASKISEKANASSGPLTQRALFRYNHSHEQPLIVTPTAHCNILGRLKCIKLYAQSAADVTGVNSVVSVADSVSTFNDYSSFKHSKAVTSHENDDASLVYDSAMQRFESLQTMITDTLSVFDAAFE